MSSCHDMKKGEVYHCPDCGLELQVVGECHEVGKPSSECGCHDEGGSAEQGCTLNCCGKVLVKKAG